MPRIHPHHCSDYLWFYARRLCHDMTPAQLAESDAFYASVLMQAGGLGAAW
ncbi:hypothetical protein [Oxalicibacterium faecigallinarum]|uniref:Uncharacterized protein n=1 Tax=Oxalicibacterium faecigallinarum TaxID=573741 RepID=A0A8J3AUF9_9BURK|nr:hypothetical protein [Oxalicibacterium faecigallinarum]GGI21083.1 hypothetical protein GCM10008066_27290 [Oxalicibacterium faecigallinarum]